MHRPDTPAWRYGHEQAARLPARARRSYRREVEQAMRAHKGSPELRAAIRRTSRLLSYSSTASQPHRWLTERLTVVRERHRARAVLQRIIELYTLIAHEPHRFKSAEVEHLALARTVLFMARRKRPAYRAQTYRKPWWLAAGRLIAGELAAFAILFTRENVAPLLEADNNTERSP